MKLRTRLTLITAIITFSVTVILALVLLFRARYLQTEAAKENLLHLSGSYAKEIQLQFETYYDIVQTLAVVFNSYEDFSRDDRRIRFNETMWSVIVSYPRLVGVYSVWKPNVLDGRDSNYVNSPGSDASGNYMSFYSRDEEGDPELNPYPDARRIIAALESSADLYTISNPIYQNVEGAQALTSNIEVPIITPSGEAVGVVGVIVNLAFVQDEILKIHPYDTGYATLYANNGIVVAHQDTNSIGKNYSSVSREVLGAAGIADVGEALKDGKPALVENNGQMIQLYPFSIGSTSTPWSLLTVSPLDSVLADVHSLTGYTIILAVIVVLLSAVVIFFVTSKIVKPILRVNNTLKDISEGEGDLTKQVEVTSNDEIGTLSHYFNLTLDKIRNLVITIKSQSATLADIGNDLASNMTETAAAINQIAANIQSIKDMVVNQSASVTETNSTMEQITANINKVTDQIEHQTESVSQSSSAIEEMMANIQSVARTLDNNAKNVRELLESSEIGRSGLQEMTSDIQEITRESEGLLEINAVMENIASQTNLLSMNAAIEAAHAGEAGKGFAVVADEIRKLAESSGEQSKTIGAVLKKIKDSIDKITKSADAVLNKFEVIDNGVKTVSNQTENMKNAMEEQSAGSKQVLESMGQLHDITRTVKDGSVEMLSGSKEVIAESKNLGSLTQEISSGMNEMASGADQINVAVTRVNELTSQNKNNIDILVREVSRFKVD